MTVESILNRKEYEGDDATTSFDTNPVQFFDSDELDVYVVVTATGAETLLVENTDYTVTGGDGATGTVNLAGGSSPYGAPASTETLVIVRTLDLLQETDLEQNDESDAEVLEDALDRGTMMIQQLSAGLERSIKLDDSDVTGADTTLPTPEAGTFLGWDDTGLALTNYTLGEIGAEIAVTAYAETLLGEADGDAFFQNIVDDATAESAPDVADVLMFSDVSLTPDDGRKCTVQQLFNAINALTADADPLGATDYVPTYDASASAVKKVLLNDLPVPVGTISGLIQSNAADADHDISISAGVCADSTGVYTLRLASALVKQIDAAWAVGTNAGGLDTGAVGNATWYYIHLIRRSDTGVVDALFSTSSTSPTMPTNYDQKRLIGAVITDGSANIVAFTAMESAGGGLDVLWSVPTLDVDLAATLTTSERTDVVKVPTAFKTHALLNVVINDASNSLNWIHSPDDTDAAPSATAAPLYNIFGQAGIGVGVSLRVRTSSAGAIAARSTVATIDNYRVSTIGFEWSRR